MGETRDNVEQLIDFSDDTDLVDLVAKLLGNGSSKSQIRSAIFEQWEIPYERLTSSVMDRLIANAHKLIIAQWKDSPETLRGTILQGICNDLSNPNTVLKHRTQLRGLLIKLAQQLPEDVIPDRGSESWAHKTPDQVVQAMDDLTDKKGD